MRQQLSTVISHCQVTLFTLDTDRRISMLEGALVRDTTGVGSPDAGSQGRPGWYIGKNVYDVFFRLGAGQELDFLRPIDDVFEGKTSKGARECKIRKSQPRMTRASTSSSLTCPLKMIGHTASSLFLSGERLAWNGAGPTLRASLGLPWMLRNSGSRRLPWRRRPGRSDKQSRTRRRRGRPTV